jgi:CO/xanthine dehydrogenase FAD-binding subunit
MTTPSGAAAVRSPASLDDALDALAADPGLVVLAGGTDLMVQLNYGVRRPAGVLSLRRVPGLRGWRVDDGALVIGARTTYTELLDPGLATLAPALAQAARTVGSPQIRNTGTIGGNLATASPAGDTLPVLVAAGATVELASATGRRAVAVTEFLTGPKRTALVPGELVVGVRLPVAAGPQEYLKVGVRNAMVIAVASCALVVDVAARRLGVALGSAGPVPVRCGDAEAFAAAGIDWAAGTPASPAVLAGFAERVAAAAAPIDDHRATAAYRRHACGVLARRALARSFP